MAAILAGVIGLVVGAALTWSLLARRPHGRDDEFVRVTSDLAVRDAELAALREATERARLERDEEQRRQLLEFESLSHRVVKDAMAELNSTQEQVIKQSESNLDRTLKPLTDLLDEYKRNLAEFDKQHVGALSDVRNSTEQLLGEQKRTRDETRRLNQLLGRSDHRGRWGEIQLANVLEASGLKQGVDFDLQVSGTNDAGRTQRPDCVVKLPNGLRVAVDAKFPFDAFEAAIASEDANERRALQQKHAKDLRAHVRTLRDKAYWESIAPSPEFVACFVPSDVAVSMAYDADPELLSYGFREQVLIVGPTNLLSLLMSVALLARQQKLAINAEEIYRVAATIYDRIRLVAEPVARMGKALDTQVREYNSMISSFESRLIVSASHLQELGVTSKSKEMPELAPVERLAARPNELKWGVEDAASLPSSVLDLEALDETE